MWLLSVLPSVLFHLLTLLSIAALLVATFVGSVPIIKKYKFLAQIGSIVVLCIAFYFEGGLAYKTKIDVDVARLETKMKDAQIAAGTANTKLEAALSKKVEVIHDRGDTIIQYLDRNKEKLDANCVVSKDAIEAHNQATKISEADPVLPGVTLTTPPAADTKPKKFKLPWRTN